MKKFKLLIMCALPLAAMLAVSSCKTETEDIPVDKVEWDADLKADVDGKTVDTDQAPFSVADKVTVTPDNATHTVVYDSSNKDVATISAEGEITVVSAGKTNIKATAGGKTDLFLLTVVAAPVPVAKVEWAAELKEGKTVEEGTEPFNVSTMVTITPTDATDRTLEYDSTNKDVATISTTGVITILGQGTTIISATAHNDQKDEFTLTVIERTSIGVESVTWAPDVKAGVAIDMNQTLDVSAKTTVLPSIATDPTVTYDSSDKGIATISDAGLITPVAPGTTEIKAMAGEKEDTFTLTVSIAVAFDSYLTPAAIVVPVGATNRIWGHIDVTPVPTDLKTKNIAFSSDKEDIATVDEYGVVIGVAPGNAKITVAATNNADAKVVLDVTVVAATYYPRNTAESATTPWTMTTTPAVTNTATVFDGIYRKVYADADVTWLSIAAGTNHGNVTESSPLEFVVDMKLPQVVNVFKIIHRAGPNTNRLVRIFGFDEISGSNDGENFTTIATMVEVADAQSPLYCAISETVFENSTAYQYIKFTCKTKNFCFIYGIAGYPGVSKLLDANRNPDNDPNINNGNIQNHSNGQGGSAQLQELYLGKY
jgi:uncharacterized protein YjdB